MHREMLILSGFGMKRFGNSWSRLSVRTRAHDGNNIFGGVWGQVGAAELQQDKPSSTGRYKGSLTKKLTASRSEEEKKNNYTATIIDRLPKRDTSGKQLYFQNTAYSGKRWLFLPTLRLCNSAYLFSFSWPLLRTVNIWKRETTPDITRVGGQANHVLRGHCAR